MKFAWAIPVPVLFLVLGVIGACFFFRFREPRADGKSLSTWLEYGISHNPVGDDPSAPTLAEIETAIRKIGPRAVPVLLKKIQARDAAWEPVARNFAQKHKRLGKWLRFSSASEQHNLAAYGFGVLNGEAISALPVLTIMLFDTNAPSAVSYCLASIGLPALPALKNALTNENPAVRQRGFDGLRPKPILAREALPELKLFRPASAHMAGRTTSFIISLSPTNEAVPLIAQALEDFRPEVINAGLYWVRKLGTNARPLIPQLTNLFAHPDLMTRGRATGTLKIIDPVAAFAAGVNTNPPAPPIPGTMRRRGRYQEAPAK